MARAGRRLLLGAIGLALAAAVWHTSDLGPAHGAALRDAALDLDARVALLPPRSCEPRAASVRLLGAGSAPRLDAAARFVWFEAPGPDGRAQVFRLERATRRAECLSCDEPGNNRRPAPHPTARAVVFDTDRWASWRRPFDRELMVLTADEGARRPARRLTWDAAADTHALYDPSGLGIAWSRRTLVGRALRAPIKLGHGSLSLGRRVVLARGGLTAATPLAWSPDARAFVWAGGFATARWVERVDFAASTRDALPAASAFDASVTFSADGELSLRAERARGATRVWLEARGSSAHEVALGDAAGWGEPTGVALVGDGSAFALGQRRAAAERIVWVELACASGASASE